MWRLWVYVCVCLSASVFHYSFVPHSHVHVSSKANWLLSSAEHTCLWWGNIHPHPHSIAHLSGTAGWEKRGADHPGLSSQRATLMWQKHMCSACVQSLTKHTCKTQFLLPPVRHHYSLSLERWDARKEKVREWQPPPVPGSARLKYWGRMVTLREGKPAQSNHISINQLSSNVNRGPIRENSGERLFYSAFFPTSRHVRVCDLLGWALAASAETWHAHRH